MSDTELYGYVKSSADGRFLSDIAVTAYHANGALHANSTTDGGGRYSISFPRNSGIWNLSFECSSGTFAPEHQKALIVNVAQQQQNVVSLSPATDREA